MSINSKIEPWIWKCDPPVGRCFMQTQGLKVVYYIPPWPYEYKFHGKQTKKVDRYFHVIVKYFVYIM